MQLDDRKFLEFNEKYILETWKKHEDFPPMVLFARNSQFSLMPVHELMGESHHKQMLNDLIRVFAKKTFADRVALISESWMAKFEGSKTNNVDRIADKELNKYGSISNMPNKIEVVMLSLWTKELNILKLYNVDRLKGALEPQEEMQTPITEEMIGNFQNPFKPNPQSN